MIPILQTKKGKIVFSNDVLARMAGAMAVECYGIVGMASRRAMDGIVELLGMDNLARGIEIHVDEDEVIIDLYVVVKYGISIEQAGINIRDTVKYNVENLTGLQVSRINVHIEGIEI